MRRRRASALDAPSAIPATTAAYRTRQVWPAKLTKCALQADCLLKPAHFPPYTGKHAHAIAAHTGSHSDTASATTAVSEQATRIAPAVPCTAALPPPPPPCASSAESACGWNVGGPLLTAHAPRDAACAACDAACACARQLTPLQFGATCMCSCAVQEPHSAASAVRGRSTSGTAWLFRSAVHKLIAREGKRVQR